MSQQNSSGKAKDAWRARTGDWVDYTHARWAPVINCMVQFEDTFLLVKRSSEVNIHPNTWHIVGGYLDDKKSLEEKVYEELGEELGLKKENIISIRRGDIFDIENPQYGKTFVVHPVLVTVNTNVITLDWEAQEYAWVMKDEIETYDTLPSFSIILKSLSL